MIHLERELLWNTHQMSVLRAIFKICLDYDYDMILM